ncbi:MULTISPECIES: hypothetical protein [Microbacterium]|uniref:hypothetical protein n=1 Tax=Microbacterium TaxID=33882 RepID=UPI00217F1219|nr:MULTISPECIES: hypothetical protein [Microbacterium]UWF77988.1 hypothetical protein JSY13_02765 [Microbacterium neungamense]WCM56166.1 hypothetical protein JRG78_02790 [Microbacterium sp. EF45047]
MTIIETTTREEATAERDRILRTLAERYGTEDRTVLREISVSGEMPLDDVGAVDELIGFDFLLKRA